MDSFSFALYKQWRARYLWRKVRNVLRFIFEIRLSSGYSPSVLRLSGSSSVLQSSSALSSSSSSDTFSAGKYACICVCNVDKYEWYLFNVSDDIRHNQPPPPAKYINCVPFHEDDESGAVNLNPKVSTNMDWILGWAILGSNILYTLDDWSGDWRGPSVWEEGNRVDRIDLSGSRAEWERLPQMPNQIAASAHTFVLGGKFYCLGGFRSKKELMRQLPLAMAYDLSVNGGDSLPGPPCLNLDKILSASREFLQLESESSLKLERQSYLELERRRQSYFELEKRLCLDQSEKMELERQWQSWLDKFAKMKLKRQSCLDKSVKMELKRRSYLDKTVKMQLVRQRQSYLKLEWERLSYWEFEKQRQSFLELERPLCLDRYEKMELERWLYLDKSEKMELQRQSYLELERPLCLDRSEKMELETQLCLETRLCLDTSEMMELERRLSLGGKISKLLKLRQNLLFERGSWAMVYDPSLNVWEFLPDPPNCPDKVDSIFSAVRESPNPCIVVGLPEEGLLQIYYANVRRWEKQEFKICPKFGPNVLTGPALAVDSKLYWYSVDDLCLVGYDLETMMWFLGNFPIHDHGEHFGVRDVDTPPRLAHLGGDKFCLLWVSVLPHKGMKISLNGDDCISRLHCMKLRVTTGNFHSVNGIIPLEVSILSCQSYLASGLKFFCGGLVVDGHSRYSDA